MTEHKKTVLVIDDEPDTRVFITTLLEDNDYDTVTAADGKEALDKVKANAPDLITLDITMPEQSGAGFYKQMRQSDEWKSIPIIIVTGISSDFERFISTRRQVPPPDGYVTKPIDQQRLLDLASKLTS